jgi:hypothetical protein
VGNLSVESIAVIKLMVVVDDRLVLRVDCKPMETVMLYLLTGARAVVG